MSKSDSPKSSDNTRATTIAAEVRSDYEAAVAQVTQTARELNELSRQRVCASAAPAVLRLKT
jgi:hypothetical protein